MAGLGAIKGLSYVNDWDKDIERVYQQAEYAASVKERKEQETLFYANLMKKGHGNTPYVQGKLDTFYKGLTKQVADFAINNPNFRTDVSKMQEFLSLNDQFLNNPILQQDLQVKQQFEKLQNAYNDGKITKTHLEREMQKYNAYAYADPNTDADPYMFANPKVIDVNQLVNEGQAITPKITMTKQNGLKWETYQGVNPTAVLNTATSLLADEDNRLAFQKEYDDAIKRDSSIKTSFKTLEEYTASRIEAGNSMQLVKSEYDEAYLRNLSNGGKTETPGAYFMRNIFPTLSSLQDGQSTTGDLHGLPLTAFGELNRPITTNPGSGVKVRDKNGNLTDLGVTINMAATNFTGYVRHGGKLYGEVQVNANSTLLDKEGKPLVKGSMPAGSAGTQSSMLNSSGQPLTANEYLTDLGFVAAAQNSSNPASMFFNTTGMDYSGKVYVELDMSPSRLIDVDRSYGGQTEVPRADAYYNDARVRQQVDNLNKITPSGMVDDPDFISQVGSNYEYVTIQGKSTNANGERYVRNINTGEISAY